MRWWRRGQGPGVLRPGQALPCTLGCSLHWRVFGDRIQKCSEGTDLFRETTQSCTSQPFPASGRSTGH